MDVKTHRTEVLELVARAAFAIDDGDALGWAQCFTEDGALRTTRPTEIVGREALAAFAQSWRSGRDTIPRHVSWHHRLEADGDDIVGRCSAAVLAAGAEGIGIELTARYRDRYRLVAGHWQIAERLVELDRLP